MPDPALLPTGDDLRIALGALIPSAMATPAAERPAFDVWFAEGGTASLAWCRVSGSASPIPAWLKPWATLLSAVHRRSPEGVTRTLVIADPIASAVSVVWQVQDDATTGSELEGDLRGEHLLGMLRDLIDGSLGWSSETLGVC